MGPMDEVSEFAEQAFLGECTRCWTNRPRLVREGWQEEQALAVRTISARARGVSLCGTRPAGTGRVLAGRESRPD